jgi:hypothetical protein
MAGQDSSKGNHHRAVTCVEAPLGTGSSARRLRCEEATKPTPEEGGHSLPLAEVSPDLPAAPPRSDLAVSPRPTPATILSPTHSPATCSPRQVVSFLAQATRQERGPLFRIS